MHGSLRVAVALGPEGKVRDARVLRPDAEGDGGEHREARRESDERRARPGSYSIHL